MSIDIPVTADDADDLPLEKRVRELVAGMTLEEKIGQMVQVDAADGTIPEALRAAVANGRVGAILNDVDVEHVNELQRIAVEDSRLGIPLLVGRDVIHGFRTVLPIPLGLAATFDPALVERGARLAALEAAAAGVNWTFAPMIDVTRDPRWGRIAESFGEDPWLTGTLGAAMVRGFQTDDMTAPGAIAACAKHFAGYGASESGRDYNTTSIPENELRNVYLPPFKATIDAGVASLMTSFSELNGVPASGDRFLLTAILRDEWRFDGFVVSDWGSIEQMTVHGYTADDRSAAREAVNAGLNMEMASNTYEGHLAALVESGEVSEARLDEMVRGILRIKLRLGLFETSRTEASAIRAMPEEEALDVVRQAALESVVLLKNADGVLPLDAGRLDTLAVVGPLADAPYEQLGTWIFDGDPSRSRTPLPAIRELLGDSVDVRYARAMETTRSRDTDGFAEAVTAAKAADAVVVFLGEESILSGEAHSRADIDLPGNQNDLVRALAAAGKPLIAVIQAGRPLTLTPVIDLLDAVLFAWHPGTMGGPAIADLLFGRASPSGKLPATFPAMVGQVPIYYAHKNTGKPPTPASFVHIDDIEVTARQTSFGMTSFHLDAGYEPLFPFGHGLSYARFSYSGIEVDRPRVRLDEAVTVRATVTNDGDVAAVEVVQLYVRDLVGSVTRPVRELKGFERVRLAPGESRAVSFELRAGDLAFHGRDMRLATEPGDFHVWVGGSSDAELRAAFTIVDE